MLYSLLIHPAANLFAPSQLALVRISPHSWIFQEDRLVLVSATLRGIPRNVLLPDRSMVDSRFQLLRDGYSELQNCIGHVSTQLYTTSRSPGRDTNS